MSKIKLLILLLISFLYSACSSVVDDRINKQFKVGYIGGEYDGLILDNILTNYLKSFNAYNKYSNYEIKSSIEHSGNVYITNIDNTSDREKIETIGSFEVIDQQHDCYVFQKNYEVEQFYIFASGDKFLSNQKANEKIRYNNTEEVIKKFWSDLSGANLYCE